MKRRGRILIAKPGLDGHDRGAKVIARSLRDEGFEVIYTGLHQTPEMIAESAIQESVDVVGISILSGAHNTLVPEIIEILKKRGCEDISIVVGGIIPDDDIPFLIEKGVKEVFQPGSSLKKISEKIKTLVEEKLLKEEKNGL